jgi:hypothetical protein
VHVGERRRRRLVDDPEHVETRDDARVLGRLALPVGEVRGDRDDRFGTGLAEEVLSRLAIFWRIIAEISCGL